MFFFSETILVQKPAFQSHESSLPFLIYCIIRLGLHFWNTNKTSFFFFLFPQWFWLKPVRKEMHKNIKTKEKSHKKASCFAISNTGVFFQKTIWKCFLLLEILFSVVVSCNERRKTLVLMPVGSKRRVQIEIRKKTLIVRIWITGTRLPRIWVSFLSLNMIKTEKDLDKDLDKGWIKVLENWKI